MNMIRSILMNIAGLAVALFGFVVLAVTGLAVLGFTAFLAVIGTIAALVTSNRAKQAREQNGPRVWNDGRGTIIDM